MRRPFSLPSQLLLMNLQLGIWSSFSVEGVVFDETLAADMCDAAPPRSSISLVQRSFRRRMVQMNLEKTATKQNYWQSSLVELEMRIEQRESDYWTLESKLREVALDLGRLQSQRKALMNDGLGHGSNGHSTSTNSSRSDALFVPVPYFMHDKPVDAAFERPVSPFLSDLFGDAFEPAKEEAGPARQEVPDRTSEGVPLHDVPKKAGHGHGYVAILFLFGSLVIGSLLQMVLLRLAPALPYTCGLFILGGFVSWVHWMNRSDPPWDSWYDSVEIWQGINPHLLFYLFLPALLFGDVIKLKVQLVAVCSKQIVLLACPGVLLGTFLTACFGRYVLPYGWGWPICFVFGSVLSATDPVAVVSLFNTLGVSPKLTMLVSGESLVNDGTAIVCFALAHKVALGATLLPLKTALFFLHMTFTAAIVGLIAGFLAVAFISYCSEDQASVDSMIQVVTTMCCGYLAFFFSESELASSGVIAIVVSGLTIAYSAWPLFISRETVRTVWEAIEFICNTVIFFLAGVIFMGCVLEANNDLGYRDVLWLIVLYVGMFIIRAVMMCVFWIPLNMAGSQLHWQEGVAMVWSGLRGAVSVAMGLIVDIEPGIDHKIGSQVMFHVGGIAAMTLIINATTTPHLLRALGLVKTENMMNRIGSKLSARIVGNVRTTFEKQLHNSNDARFFGASPSMVQAMVPALQNQPPEKIAESLSTDRSRYYMKFHLNAHSNMEWRLVQVFREVFLRVVQSKYWQGVEDGVVPRHLMVYRVLLHSTEEALDNTWQCLNDWDIIAKSINAYKTTRLQRFMSQAASVWPFRQIPQCRRASMEFQNMLKVFIALSYIEAHTFATDELPPNIGADDAMDMRVQKQVVHESNLQRQKAYDLIYSLPPQAVEMAKSEMLARRLLQQQVSEVEHMKDGGFLTTAEADHLIEPCRNALRDIAHLPHDTWHERSYREEVASSDPAAPDQSTQHDAGNALGMLSRTSSEAPMPVAPKPSFRLAAFRAAEKAPAVTSMHEPAESAHHHGSHSQEADAAVVDPGGVLHPAGGHSHSSGATAAKH